MKKLINYLGGVRGTVACFNLGPTHAVMYGARPPRLTNRGSLTALLHSPGPRRPATRNFSARPRRSSAKRDSSRADHTARSDIMLLGYFQNKAESH